MVYLYGQLSYPVTSNSAHAIIAGLPVAAANAVYGYVTSSVITGNVVTGGPVGLSTTGNGSILTASLMNGGIAVTNAQLSNGYVEFMIVYPAA
jgi:hypothetical protein